MAILGSNCGMVGKMHAINLHECGGWRDGLEVLGKNPK